jgi:hypothetical protein
MAYTDDLIPTMTNFTSPSGEVTADAYYTTYYPWKAFNKNTADYWYIYTAAKPHYLGYDFGVGVTKKITKYTILPYSGSAYLPIDFKFQGSNNGADWTDLDTQVGLTTGWETDVRRPFTFSNTTAYRYYRLYITKCNDETDTQVALREVEMMETIQAPTGAAFLFNMI